MHKVQHAASKAGAQLVTEKAYAQGEIVASIADFTVVSTPTYQTIQIGAGQHIEELGVIDYMNHSCAPNTEIDTTAMTIRAARDIAPGEPLTFFYPSTEWEMDRPFICACGAERCVGLVAGAKYLSVAILSRYFINEHIRLLILDALTPLSGPEMVEAATHRLLESDLRETV